MALSNDQAIRPVALHKLIKESGLSPTQQAAADAAYNEVMSNVAKQQAIRNIQNVGMAGLGAGTVLAGLRALMRLNREQVSHKTIPTGGTVNVELFAPEKKRNLRKKNDPSALAYSPMQLGFGVPSSQMKLASELANVVQHPIQYAKELGSNVVSGAKATTPMQLPWYLPAVVGAGALSFGASHLASNAIMKRLRDDAMKAELAKAEQEYEQALAAPPASKTASERGELARNFDRLIDVFEKHAVASPMVSPGTSQAAGLLAGLYLTTLMAGGAMGARAGFNAGSKDWKTNALRRAQLQRLQLAGRDQPVELAATPVVPQPQPLIEENVA